MQLGAACLPVGAQQQAAEHERLQHQDVKSISAVEGAAWGTAGCGVKLPHPSVNVTKEKKEIKKWTTL